jgi:hypothetical protein
MQLWSHTLNLVLAGTVACASGCADSRPPVRSSEAASPAQDARGAAATPATDALGSLPSGDFDAASAPPQLDAGVVTSATDATMIPTASDGGLHAASDGGGAIDAAAAQDGSLPDCERMFGQCPNDDITCPGQDFSVCRCSSALDRLCHCLAKDCMTNVGGVPGFELMSTREHTSRWVCYHAHDPLPVCAPTPACDPNAPPCIGLHDTSDFAQGPGAVLYLTNCAIQDVEHCTADGGWAPAARP